MSGQSLNQGEYYLVISNEVIFEHEDQSDLDNRTTVSIYVNPDLKLQIGLEYRLERLIREGLEQKLWLKLGSFLRIN